MVNGPVPQWAVPPKKLCTLISSTYVFWELVYKRLYLRLQLRQRVYPTVLPCNANGVRRRRAPCSYFTSSSRSRRNPLPRCSLLPSFKNPRSTLLSTGLESWTLRLTRASLSRSRRRQLLVVLAFGFTIERLGAVVRRRELAWP